MHDEDRYTVETGSYKRADTEIAESVVDSLKWHVWIPNKVQAVVENRWAASSGEAT